MAGVSRANRADGFLRYRPVQTKNLTISSMNPVVASDKLRRAEVWAEDDESVHWAGAFAVYGGYGTIASSTVVYEIEPGDRLGWYPVATEETQYIMAGTGDFEPGRWQHLPGMSWQCFCDAD